LLSLISTLFLSLFIFLSQSLTLFLPLSLSLSLIRILDRLTGYTISPVLWRYVAPGLSAGRVQSAGLYLISQRERKRWEFSESHYFSMKGAFTDANKNEKGDNHIMHVMNSKLFTINGQKVAGEPDFDGSTGELRVLTKSLKGPIVSPPIVLNNESAQSVLTWLNGHQEGKNRELTPLLDFSVSNVTDKRISRKSPPAFITSTLQQECSRKLSMNPTRCMSIAQELYEEGFITYMRTDSPALSATATEAARSFVGKVFGEDFLGPTKKVLVPKSSNGTTEDSSVITADVIDSSIDVAEGDKEKKKSKHQAEEEKEAASPKNAQNAHEAIRPAEADGMFKTPDETLLSGEKKMLYGLIYRRTLASG
jgi:DNA topoisomerase-1